jgi:hypothetical protein
MQIDRLLSRNNGGRNSDSIDRVGRGPNTIQTICSAPNDTVSTTTTTTSTRSPATSTIDAEAPTTIPVEGVSPRMQTMIDALRDNYTKNCTNAGAGSAPANHSCSGARTGSLYGKCWQYVKHGLMEGGFADEYIASASALDAHTDGHLTNAGFTNRIGEYQTSGNAPAGAILIYEWTDEDSANNDGRHGHIEVKTPQGEYISDFSATSGIDTRNPERILVGIYVEDQR